MAANEFGNNNEPAPNPYAVPESLTQTGQPPVLPGTPGPQELATRWQRFAANFLDNILLAIVAIPFAILAYAVISLWIPLETLTTVQDEILSSVIVLPLLLAGLLGLHGYLLATRGQSIGKYALGIQVVDNDEGRILRLTSIVLKRYFPVFAMQLIPFVGRFLILIDALMIFGQEQRCLHDNIANTKVIVYDPNAR